MPEVVLRDKSGRPILQISDDGQSLTFVGKSGFAMDVGVGSGQGGVVASVNGQQIWIKSPNGNAQVLIADAVVDINTVLALTSGGIEKARILAGTGDPSGVVSAPQGSLYLRQDGSSTSTRAYINTNGATAWTALTTAA